MTMLAKTTALLAASASAILGAPGAAASPESDYCTSMAAVGFRGNCATYTTLARDVCAQFDHGADSATVAEKLDLATKDQKLSNYIVAGAPLYFCPNHADKV
jgi:hypothetical protein